MSTHTSGTSARKRRWARRDPARTVLPPRALRCRRKFLRYFRRGFSDPTYLDWERNYKQQAHDQWMEVLSQPRFKALLDAGDVAEVARHAVTIESRTNLLFSFEKMALRDAVKSDRGAEAFARGLYELLHGRGTDQARFTAWCDVVAELPRKQTRVLTWPVVTVFAFIARPDAHFFVKPMVTRNAATAYGFDFAYVSRPNWDTYAAALSFAETVRRDNADLKPRDMIDLQSFIWVLGSDEYP
ncbi:MAG TPA: hypothetical protein VE967_14890 [Gemmatimonadaceae bacterium]|nr:hypothetical protein [Gemmatimonadaceae bacterium]